MQPRDMATCEGNHVSERIRQACEGGKALIEIKRRCSSSVTDRGDRITFGDFTITISDDHYTRFRELMNKYPDVKPVDILSWIIELELTE